MKKATYILTFLLAGATLPSISNAGSIYLCRVYSGGSIWSSTRCNPNQAAVEREIYVPDSMSWEDRVRYGEQRLGESRALQQAATQVPYSNSTTTTNGNTVTTVTTNSQQTPTAMCQALAAEVANYDAMARQPQSGQTQDLITEQKRKARSRQAALRC